MKGYFKEILLLSVIVVATAAVSAGIYFGYNSMNNEQARMSVPLELKLRDMVRRQVVLDSNINGNATIKTAMKVIRDRLVANLKDNPYEIEILVVDSPELNAFTLPGGLIVVYTGLIRAADSPEELASVIAHEMGHVMRQDSMRMITREFGMSVLLALSGGGDSARIVRQILRDGINNQFTQKQESDADDFAIGLLERSRINPGFFADILTKLKMDTGIKKELLRYVSTHPLIEDRIKKAREKASHFKGKTKKIALNWQKVRSRLGSVFSDERD
jgi:beta-barrel assembly-enhancing protease